MKKSLILSLTLIFTIGMFSSCARKSCKGGGWYGNRNLGYAPKKDKANETCDLVSIQNETVDCEEIAD